MRRFSFFDHLLRFVPAVMAVGLPLFILPFSLDATEAAKQVFLLLLVALCGVGLMISWGFGTRPLRTRGFLVLLPLLLCVPTILSALFSLHPIVSWVGGVSQEYQSVLWMVGMAGVWWVIQEVTDEQKQKERLLHALIIGGAVSGGFGVGALLIHPNILGSILPTLNTVGTLHAFAWYLLALTSVCLLWWPKKRFSLWSVDRWLLLISTCTVLFFLHYRPLWMMLCVVSVVAIAVQVAPKGKRSFFDGRYLCSLALLMISLLGVVGPRFLQTSVPTEVTLNTRTTVHVARALVSLEPWRMWVGSGPGTFALAFQKYRPKEFAATSFWDTRFDRGSSFLLTTFVSGGVIGVIGYTGFALLSMAFGVWVWKSTTEDRSFVLGVSVGFFVLSIGGCFYSASSTLLFVWVVLSGLLASLLVDISPHKRSPQNHRLVRQLLASLGILILLIAAVLSLQKYMAEAVYSAAIRYERVGASAEKSIPLLVWSVRLNRWSDVYERRLALALLERIDAHLAQPEGGAEVAQEEAEWVRTLVARSIEAAKRARELSPQNALNAGVEGLVYEALIPLLPEASSFADAAYRTSVELEPANPARYTDVARISLAKARAARESVRLGDTSLTTDVAQWLTEAEAFLQSALALKPDYAPARFQQAIVLDEQGKTTEAIEQLEELTSSYDTDVGAMFQLGLLYVRRGNEGDARQAERVFSRVISLVPSYSNARWFLASIYETEGNYAAAFAQVEYVLSTNPNHPLVKARYERLKGQLRGTQKEAPTLPTDLEPLP